MTTDPEDEQLARMLADLDIIDPPPGWVERATWRYVMDQTDQTDQTIIGSIKYTGGAEWAFIAADGTVVPLTGIDELASHGQIRDRAIGALWAEGYTSGLAEFRDHRGTRATINLDRRSGVLMVGG